jgi:hypothetical protein
MANTMASVGAIPCKAYEPTVKVEFPLASLTLEKADILWLIIKGAETGTRNCT